MRIMRKAVCFCLIITMLASVAGAVIIKDNEQNEELTFKAFNASSKEDSVEYFTENGERVGRWIVNGNKNWTYLSIEFICDNKEYTTDNWFYFSYYVRVNSNKKDAFVNEYPKYLSYSGYAEDNKTKMFDICRSDREPYFNEDKWQKVEYIIPMKETKKRTTIRTWLCSGISSATAKTYSIDFKNPKCVRLENQFEEKNSSNIEMTDVPCTEIFEDKSSYHEDYSYKRWVREGTPETLCENILKNNIAFVKNSQWFWNKTKKEQAVSNNVFEDGVLKINSKTANQVFNTNFSEGYISPEEICSVVSQYDYFYDNRGFLLFSENIDEAIDKAPAMRDNSDYAWYRSYYSVSLAIGEISYSETEPTKEDWRQAREQYLEALTYVRGTESDYADYINSEIAEAEKLLSSVVYSQDAELPFPGKSLSDNVTYALKLSRGYAIIKRADAENSNETEIKKAALYSIDKLFEKQFMKNKAQDSNWFLNIITYPQMLCQAIACVYDCVDTVKLERYLNTLYFITGTPMITTYFVPYKAALNKNYSGDVYNSASNYTNLLWRSLVVYQISLLAENKYRMNHCLKYLNQVFELISKDINSETRPVDNGFYEDGSFLFHGRYAYNLGYGASFICAVADLEYISKNTPFDVKNVYGYDRIYSIINKSYLPFIYENTKMKIVQGRENPYGSSGEATTVVSAIISICKDCDSKETDDIKAFLKPMLCTYDRTYRWNKALSGYNVLKYPAVREVVVPFLDALKNASYPEPLTYSNIYYAMDKCVHRKKDYTFMLSMSSSKTDKYEAINDSGYSDWYTSDGMTYLLTGNAQYIQRWWNCVDRYEMPGTTVDSEERKYLSSTSNIYPDNPFAGGATDGDISVCGMVLPTTVPQKPVTVKGKKSYFMLDDKIICLGSGISDGNKEVYTTVENYISYDKNSSGETGYTNFEVDGISVPFEFDTVFNHTNPTCITVGDRGYVFLGDNLVTVEREKNDKRFAGISMNENPNAGDFPFMTVKIRHGTNPANARYGYVIYPNKTGEALKIAAQNLDFEVLRQDCDAHIIKLANGTVMANIFNSCQIDDITFKTPCSVIIKNESYGKKIYIADPTQTQTGVNIEVGKSVYLKDLELSGERFALPVNTVCGGTGVFEVISRFDSSFDTDRGEVLVKTPKHTELTIILSEYKDGKLNSAKIKKAEVFPGENRISGFETDDSNKYKVFLWNDLFDIKPLSWPSEKQGGRR